MRLSMPAPGFMNIISPSVRVMVRAVEKTEGSKRIVLSVDEAVFTAVTASLKEQSASQTLSFVSAVFVTVNVAACANGVKIRNEIATKAKITVIFFTANICIRELSPKVLSEKILKDCFIDIRITLSLYIEMSF